jgi:hypothetical protein
MTDNHLLLYRLAELMLEHEQNILPVDLLFDDEQIDDFVKSIQIDSPYQQMLLEGVLTESVRNEKLFVSFTVEGYFHYVLGEVIFNHTQGEDSESLKHVIVENKLNGVKEGVEQCLMKYFTRDYLSIIFSNSLSFENFSLLINPTTHYLIYFSRKEKIEIIIHTYINRSNFCHIELLKNCLQKLRDLGYNNLISNITKETLFRIQNEPISKGEINFLIIDLLLCYSTYLNDDENNILLSIAVGQNIEYSSAGLGVYYSNIGLVCKTIRKYHEAFRYFDYALKHSINDFQLKIQILGRIASLHSELAIQEKNKNEMDIAIKCFQEILNEINNSSDFDPLLKATQQNNYAKAMFANLMYGWEDKNKVEVLKLLFNTSFDIVVRIKGMYSDLTAKTLNNQSVFYAMIGDLQKSLDLILSGFKIVQKIYPYYSSDTSTFAFNIGNRYEQLRNFSEAEKYYHISFEINMKLSRIKSCKQMTNAYLRVLNELKKFTLVEEINRLIEKNDL